MSELEQANEAHNMSDDSEWREWQKRVVVDWCKVLILRGYATENADGTVTIHDTGRLFSASGEAI